MSYQDWLYEWTWEDHIKKIRCRNADITWLHRVRYSLKGKFFEEYAPDSLFGRIRTYVRDLMEDDAIIFIIKLLSCLCFFVCLCLSVGFLVRWWLSVIF